MKKDELIELLQRQNDFLQGKLEEALTSVHSLTSANEKLTATVEELRRQIASLEKTLKGKNIELSKEKTAGCSRTEEGKEMHKQRGKEKDTS